MPQATGSGALVRFYSNVRAWLDLGFDAEVVQVSCEGAEDREPPPELWPLRWARIRACQSSPLAGRVAYRAGVVTSAACAYYFAKHRAVCAAVAEREACWPGSLHQFEGDSIANALPFVGPIQSIYSAHDLSCAAIAATHEIAMELGVPSTAAQHRESRFIRRVERRIIDASTVTVCISKADRDFMRAEWGYSHAEYLPMTVPMEPQQLKVRSWVPGRTLRLLHIGRVSHLPSYRSLEYLLGHVFPSLSETILSRLQLNIAGRFDHNDERCRHIAELAEPFRERVRFAGFVPEIGPAYEASDLHIVTATRATGLRTRIVESFAYGVPVLASTVAAFGLEGLVPCVNILIADDPRAISDTLTCLVDNPARLAAIGAAGRLNYENCYSRDAVARQLAALTERYFSARR